MSITLQIEGRRIYFVGNTFAIKERIKQAGGKWDADRRAWWLGTTLKEKAEELVADVAQQPEQPREQQQSQTLEDKDTVLGRARYKGKEYLLVWQGQTSRGLGTKLAALDGSFIFWAKEGEPVEITKRYQRDRDDRLMTFGRLKHLRKKMADEREDEAAGRVETKTCWECGATFTFRQCRENDGDWKDSYCGC